MPETSPQNKQILKRLLAEPGNKHCADCKTATHPRWTSWNIGIFLCIRCSGVHRSLGTHISKVRSVDLDSWSDAQLVELQRWGNARANQYWEAGLPGNHVPDESKIVNFIRTKYDLKRWVAQEKPQPESLSAVSSEDVPLQQVKDRKIARAGASGGTTTAAPATQANLLDFDDFESAPPVPGKAKPAATNISRTPSLSNAPNSKTPARTTEDIFSVAPSRYTQSRPRPQASASAPQAAPAAVAAPQAPAATPRADLKKSILSLYAQKPAAAPVSSQPAAPSNNSFNTTAAPAAAALSSSAFDFDLFASKPAAASTAAPTKASAASNNAAPTSLIDSFSDLNFNSSSAPSPAPVASAAPVPSSTKAPSGTVTQSQTSNAFAPVEEDDFFANPWK